MRILTTRIITTFYRRAIVFSRSMDNVPPQITSPLPTKITVLQENDLPDYQRFRPEQPQRMIRKRIDDGDQCFLVWEGGRILHTGWVATQKKYDPYLRCTLTFQPGDIFLYDHYTDSAYRGRGLSQAREIHVLARYRQEGYRRSIAIVAIENKPAFHPFEAVGYRPIGKFTCLWWILGERIWQRHWSQEPLPMVSRWKRQESEDDHECLP